MKGFDLGEGFWEEEEPGELQEDGGHAGSSPKPLGAAATRPPLKPDPQLESQLCCSLSG